MSFKPGDLVEASYTVEKQLGIILSVFPATAWRGSFVDIYWLNPPVMRINGISTKLLRKVRKEK